MFLKKIVRWVINILILAVFFIPFYWMLLTSLKTLGDTLKFPPTFFVSDPQWQNFKMAFTKIDFSHYLKNSVIVTLSVILMQLIFTVPAAYAFARYEFKGKALLFILTLSTMMIPGQLIFLPVFLIFSKLKLINTLIPLIIPFSANAFGIFMLRQTFKQVPHELIEAARMDNATELSIIFNIMLPIAKPTVLTLSLLTFISMWNDYFWPLVMTTNNNARTLQLGIVSLRQLEGAIQHNVLMAGNVLLILPIIILLVLAQKQIVNAFTYMGQK